MIVRFSAWLAQLTNLWNTLRFATNSACTLPLDAEWFPVLRACTWATIARFDMSWWRCLRRLVVNFVGFRGEVVVPVVPWWRGYIA